MSEVLIVTGAAAAGKTTVAKRLAETCTGAAFHVSLDDVRNCVRSGYAIPEDGWNAVARMQYELAQQAVASALKIYSSAGFQCVLDDAVFPTATPVSYRSWISVLAPLAVVFVVLLPPLETLVERNRTRRGNRRLRETTLRVIYDRMLQWKDHPEILVLENVGTVDATVERIRAELGRPRST